VLLGAVVVAAYVILKPLHLLMNRHLWPLVGELFWSIVGLSTLGIVLVAFLCIVRALEGERFKIPLLGELADRM